MTTTSGTGHLQKRHAVSFADYDGDGDSDLFVQAGGAVPGDRAHNMLFRNPGRGGHWLQLKLVGTRTNRSAFGARVRVDLTGADGRSRSIFRQIDGGSSYGGSTLVETVRLGDARVVSGLTVDWPVSRSRQTFRNLEADRILEITEGSPVGDGG